MNLSNTTAMANKMNMPCWKKILKYALYGVIGITLFNVVCLVQPVLYFCVILQLLPLNFFTKYAFTANLYVMPFFSGFTIILGLAREKYPLKSKLMSILNCSLIATVVLYAFTVLIHSVTIINMEGVVMLPETQALLFYRHIPAVIAAGIFVGAIRNDIIKFILTIPLVIIFIHYQITIEKVADSMYILTILTLFVSMHLCILLVKSATLTNRNK